jgi:hypothetical protein
VLIEAIKEQQQQIRELKETLMLMRSAAGIGTNRQTTISGANQSPATSIKSAIDWRTSGGADY